MKPPRFRLVTIHSDLPEELKKIRDTARIVGKGETLNCFRPR